MDKFSTCEYCTKRGPILNGGGFFCAHTRTRMATKFGRCEYHQAIAESDITLDIEADDEAQGELF